jgi:hypothetical protein
LTATAAATLALVVSNQGAIGLLALHDADGVRWSAVAQVVVALACAVQIFALAALDLARRRDPAALLLALWLIGVFVFASFVNWTLNTRVLLPAAPAVAILIARRIADRAKGSATPPAALLLALPGLVVALVVTLADASHAASARAAAAQLAPRYRGSGTLWFQGAWGFQYYMEAAGARRVDGRDDLLAPGDVLIIPQNNSNLFALPAAAGSLAERAEFGTLGWIATMNEEVGAGFHSARWGPLPFVLGSAPSEIYRVYEIRTALQLRGTSRGESK